MMGRAPLLRKYVLFLGGFLFVLGFFYAVFFSKGVF